jgi:predicted transcriptional regulator
MDEMPKIPYAEDLIKILESSRSESRRDPDKLCDLIALIAWIRRFQKPPEKWGEADLVDLYIALQIGLDAITRSVSELDPKEMRIYQAVKEEGVLAESRGITCRRVSEVTGIPYKTCYRYLDKLIEKGFITKEKERGRNIYSVLKEKEPKNLLILEGRNFEKPDELMRFILDSFRGFSLSHGDTDINLIDPITGDKIIVENNDGEWKIKIKPQEYPELYRKNNILIPGEKVRSSEGGKIHPPEKEKSLEQFLPSEMRNEIELKEEEKPEAGLSETGPIPLLGPIITFTKQTADLDASRISGVKPLTRAYKGWCDGCCPSGNRKVIIRYKAETFDGGVMLLCEDCGREVKKKLRERDAE